MFAILLLIGLTPFTPQAFLFSIILTVIFMANFQLFYATCSYCKSEYIHRQCELLNDSKDSLMYNGQSNSKQCSEKDTLMAWVDPAIIQDAVT